MHIKTFGTHHFLDVKSILFKLQSTWCPLKHLVHNKNWKTKILVESGSEYFFLYFLNRPTHKKLTASKNTMQKEWASMAGTHIMAEERGKKKHKSGTKYYIEKSSTTWKQFSLFNCHLFLKRIYQLRNRNNKMFGKRNVMRDHKKRILWSWIPMPQWKNVQLVKYAKDKRQNAKCFKSERKRGKKKKVEII